MEQALSIEQIQNLDVFVNDRIYPLTVARGAIYDENQVNLYGINGKIEEINQSLNQQQPVHWGVIRIAKVLDDGFTFTLAMEERINIHSLLEKYLGYREWVLNSVYRSLEFDMYTARILLKLYDFLHANLEKNGQLTPKQTLFDLQFPTVEQPQVQTADFSNLRNLLI